MHGLLLPAQLHVVERHAATPVSIISFSERAYADRKHCKMPLPRLTERYAFPQLHLTLV